MTITQEKTNIEPTVDESIIDEAVALAEKILKRSKELETPDEKQQSQKIARMMEDPIGKIFTIQLSDQAFRSQRNRRIANQIQYLIQKYGLPTYLSQWDRTLLALGNTFAPIIPDIVVPSVIARLRQETGNVIVPSEKAAFRPYIESRKALGIRLNINHLGEAILGEQEAQNRLQAYLNLIAQPDIEYISIKISSIFSQITLVDFDWTVEKIKEKLRLLYRQALTHQTEQNAKFVNLDMEEYRDLHLTVQAFTEVLDEPEFFHYRAGIVLQAYLPDSATVQQELTAWAIERVNRGGAPIKLRIVKGANLAMEQVEAAWHGWEQAPYRSKAEVDANYKRMVTYGCQPDHIRAVNLGIASHNLFDLAYALVLRNKYDISEHMDFEMLEGMANHQARALKEFSGDLLFYAPVVKKEDFRSAIAYLVRRLDENTAEENFLHDLFGLEIDSPKWHKQKNAFTQSVKNSHSVGAEPQRTQDRQHEEIVFDPNEPFRNVADTDWSLPQNQAWIRHIRDEWQHKTINPIPLQINGQWIDAPQTGQGFDPADLSNVRYTYVQATQDHVEQALQTAKQAESKWQQTTINDRKHLLVQAAETLANRRAKLLGAMMLDGGKRPEEADPEISEGIDFANYYARSLDLHETELSDCDFTPLGTVLITPPWNFPFAIPAGGTLAALMAGNTVIFKPAPEAVLVGWEIVNALWDAGIPKDVLQFVPTTDDEVGQSLVTDERVNGVILTGAYQTAKLFLSWKPNLKLFAETSGKNSMIITGMADHDLAIKDLVKSAFGHAGQKCSASSIAILEKEVYENPAFLRQLKDAAESMKVGHAWDLSSIVTPIIREPGQDLHRALTQLDAGERWLLEPQEIQPNMWTPGIKIGVKRGSFYHKTECFGPVLGLMEADSLSDAIDIANDVDYGLTSGLQSLDEREIDYWQDHIEAGNAYVNRGTTGAIVERQPFGGWKKSVFGYAKAGGQNYVLSLGTWTEKSTPSDADAINTAKTSYAHYWKTHFSAEHHEGKVLGEDNIFRYKPIERVLLFLSADESLLDVQRVALGTQTCGISLTIYATPDYAHLDDLKALNLAPINIQSEADFIQTVQQLENPYHSRVRVLTPPTTDLYRALNDRHITLIDAPVVSNGRLELHHYMHEQAVSRTTHRYGNIIE